MMSGLVSVILMMFLDSISSLSSLERMVLEMEQLEASVPNSVDMKSFTRLAQKPSDRKLLEAAKSYVGDVTMSLSLGAQVRPQNSPGRVKREVGEFGPSDDLNFVEYQIGDFKSQSIAMYGPFPTSFLNIDLPQPVEVYHDDGSLTCTANYGSLVCLDSVTMKFSTIPLPGSERARQYYQIVPGDQPSGLYVFQIKYSKLIDGDHVNVDITVFHANFTAEIGDDGKRVVELKILDTYDFEEKVDHEVTYQANIELLKVNDGIYLAFIDPETANTLTGTLGTGLVFLYFSCSSQKLEVIKFPADSESILKNRIDVNHLKDVELFANGGKLYLFVAQSEYSALFSLTKDGKDSTLELDSLFPAAYKVEYFHNSFGSFLILVDHQNLSTSYLIKEGNFITMQSGVWLGSYDKPWKSVGLPDPGSLFSEQELVLVKEGPSPHFLQFSAPGLVKPSRSLTLPTVAGSAVPYGLERLVRVHPHNNDSTNFIYAVGAIVADPNLSATMMERVALRNYSKEDIEEGFSNLEVFEIEINVVKSNHYANIDDLSNSVGQLENQILEIEKLGDFLSRDDSFGDHIPLNKSFSAPNVALEANSVVFSGTFSKLENLNIDVKHNSDQASFQDVDYNKNSSRISRLERKLTAGEDDYIYKYSVMKNSSQPITFMPGASINLYRAVVHSATVGTLDSTTLRDPSGTQNMASFLTNTLKTKDWTIDRKILFSAPVNVTDTTTFVNETASTKSTRVNPHKMLDTKKQNNLTVPISFTNLLVQSESQVSGTINGISLSDLVVGKDDSEPELTITGVKTFTEGLTAVSNISVEGTINGKAAKNYLDCKFLYGYDPADPTNKDFIQRIDTNRFYFKDIKVKNELTVDKMGSKDLVDVTAAELDRIVVNNAENQSISGDFVFAQHVKIKNLVSSSVNKVNPADIFIDGVDQTFNFPIQLRQLVTNNLTLDTINGVNLSAEVARTDLPNTFAVPVTFTQLGVETSINMTEGKLLGGADVSLLTSASQLYRGVITITKEVTIDQDNVPVGFMDFGSFSDQNVSKSSLEDRFLYKDTQQTLPSLTTFPAETTVFFDELSLRSTLDGLDLKNGVIHSGDREETSSVDISLAGGLTKFYQNVLVLTDEGAMVEEPKIGKHNLRFMEEQIFCNTTGRVTFQGKKTLKRSLSSDETELTSYYDVKVEGDLEVNGRKIIKDGIVQMAQLGRPNEFQGDVTFNKSVAVSQKIVADKGINSTNEDAVLLNGRNIKQFDQDIVKKTPQTNVHVSTPVSMKVSINSMSSAILTGDIDGTNILTYLDERILLDEGGAVNVDIEAASLTFQSGLTINPEKNQSDSYFMGRNLVDYKASLMSEKDTVLKGALNLTGGLRVMEDLVFQTGVFPFNVDLEDLNQTGLTKSGNQTIDLEYFIAGDILRVEKIKTDQIDGVLLDDICLKDENCSFSCAMNSSEPCLKFTDLNQIVGDSRFTNFDTNYILQALDSNNNSYNLDQLEVAKAGANLDWTTDREGDGSVSELYRNLVVRSDKDWASRDSAATAQQNISGDVVFKGALNCKDVTVTSGKVNQHKAEEVNIMALVADAATKHGANNFSCHKTFLGNVLANSLDVSHLKDVAKINQINLTEYRRGILTTEDEEQPENTNYTQELTGFYQLRNGIAVNGSLDVAGEIDGLKVEDLVRTNSVRKNVSIPEVTFSGEVSVLGDIDAEGTAFQSRLVSFMEDERIELKSASNISHHLKFLGSVSVVGDASITKLNGIPASTWVKTGVELEVMQNITALKVFDQELLVVNGNLSCNNISGTDLSFKYSDAIKHDENALIAGPALVFVSQTKMVNEVVNATLTGPYGNDADTFVSDLRMFINNLYDFYMENIVNVLPGLVKEIEVARRLDLGTITYMEEASLPAILTDESQNEVMNFNSSQVSALSLGENLVNFNYRVSTSTNCSLPDGCLCEETELLSLLDSKKDKWVTSQDSVFSFSLQSGTFNLQSGTDSHSKQCSVSEDREGGLVISGFINDVPDLPSRINFLNPAIVGSLLTPTNLTKLCSNCTKGYVVDAVMWELGDKVVFLAVASVYRELKVQLFRLDLTDISPTWSDWGQLQARAGLDFSQVHKLAVVKFWEEGGLTEKVHLYVARKSPVFVWEVEMSEILVFEMNRTAGVISPSTGMTELDNEIAVPGYVDFEVFLFQETPTSRPQILLLVAENVNFNFGPHLSVLVTFMYNNVESPGYTNAILPDNVQFVGDKIVKIEAAEISNHTVIIIAETTQLGIYKFIPYQGLRLVDSIKAGHIVDFTVFKSQVEGDELLSVSVLETGMKIQMYHLRHENHVPTINLVFGRY